MQRILSDLFGLVNVMWVLGFSSRYGDGIAPPLHTHQLPPIKLPTRLKSKALRPADYRGLVGLLILKGKPR